jgi:hypothetical protein
MAILQGASKHPEQPAWPGLLKKDYIGKGKARKRCVVVACMEHVVY